MAIDRLANHLARLLATGSLPATALSVRSREALRPLFDAGVLVEGRAGAGRRVEVADPAALAAFCRRLYPSGLEGAGAGDLPPRGRAVVEARDAKRARKGGAEPILLRGFGEAVLRRGGETLAVADWTRRAGVAAVVLDDGPAWGFDGTVAVVENLEVFLHLERLGLPCDLALYAGGRLSRRALAWLASPALGPCRFVHCGDYDPVGLDEYLRLLEACPGRTSLFLPSGLEERLAAWGKAELLGASPGVLARIRRHPDPACRLVVGWLDRYGVGLEQEALLVTDPGAERVAIVDEANRVVGEASRREMRARNLIHRATYVLVFNSRGELCLQKRTRTKDVYPGCWDVAAGGVVLAGEGYEESAERELAEELGVRGAPLAPLFEFFHDAPDNRVWGRAFRCLWDGALTLQASEVEAAEWVRPEEALERAEREPFTPDGVALLRRVAGAP
ncbi:MAG: NUDIX hydrolase YfcD [Deferrisomatales bacterium]